MKGEAAPDHLVGTTHPRAQFNFIGHPTAEALFLEAYRSNRLHHAWLIGGEVGIGKATLAYRIARFLLANPDPSSPTVRSARDLSVFHDSPAARKIAAGSHPNLFVLRREVDAETGKSPLEISVKVARKASDFFAKTSSEQGWRIAIVDTTEDLNTNSANALLKLIEEPPERSMFLFISNAPGRLLPTIRSRCRHLRLKVLADADLKSIACAELGDEGASLVTADLLSASHGSARRLFTLLDGETGSIRQTLDRILETLPNIDYSEALTLAEKLSHTSSQNLFDEFVAGTSDWIARELHRREARCASELAPLAELWNKLHRSLAELQTYNLDKRPFILSLFQSMADLAASSIRVK